MWVLRLEVSNEYRLWYLEYQQHNNNKAIWLVTLFHGSKHEYIDLWIHTRDIVLFDYIGRFPNTIQVSQEIP